VKDVKCSPHLDFDEVRFAESYEISVVLQVRSVVAFDKRQSVNSSLTLQTTAAEVRLA